MDFHVHIYTLYGVQVKGVKLCSKTHENAPKCSIFVGKFLNVSRIQSIEAVDIYSPRNKLLATRLSIIYMRWQTTPLFMRT